MLLTVLVGLILLTSCKSVSKAFFEPVPDLPDYPTLSWELVGDKYALSETDADTLLDFFENKLGKFKLEYEFLKLKIETL